jgi:hypothetical protein
MLWTLVYLSLGVALLSYVVIGYLPRRWIVKNKSFVPTFLLPKMGIPTIPGYRYLNSVGKTAYVLLYLSMSILIGTSIFGVITGAGE